MLERGEQLRTVLNLSDRRNITLAEKLSWIKDAAEGLRHIHQSGIIHADVGCHNMILVKGCLKLIDFEGCSLDGEEATSGYEWFSYRDSSPPISLKTDIFAFGCAIYEIMTGNPPYQELSTSEDPRRDVMQLYAEDRYPVVEELPLGEIMQGCWNGSFDSASALIKALDVANNSIMDQNIARRRVASLLCRVANISRLLSARLLSWCRRFFDVFRRFSGLSRAKPG